jgi:hypothetical protein
MDDANGSLQPLQPPVRAPKPTKGKPAGGINGATKSPLNGHAVGLAARPAKRARPSGPGLLARAFSIAAR